MAFWRRRKQVHVSTEGGATIWRVTVDGKHLVHGNFSTRARAVAAGRLVAEAVQPSELFVHGKDGLVKERATYPKVTDPPEFKG